VTARISKVSPGNTKAARYSRDRGRTASGHIGLVVTPRDTIAYEVFAGIGMSPLWKQVKWMEKKYGQANGSGCGSWDDQ